MKNQNDLIISIVSIVLFLVIGGVCYGTKKEPVAPAPPASVPTNDPDLPAGITPVMANGLAGGGGGGGGAAAGGGGGGGGRPGKKGASRFGTGG